MKGIMVNKHRIVHVVHDWNILKGKQRVLEMVPILYFSVVTRGNIIIFGYKFLGMAQKACEYSYVHKVHSFLMGRTAKHFWPIKLILTNQSSFKIFQNIMNMICWLAKYFLRIFFSMNIENGLSKIWGRFMVLITNFTLLIGGVHRNKTQLKLKLSCFAGLLLD